METLSVFAKGLFVGQTVLITGGGTGIGLATARLLGGLGARVVLCARTLPRLEEAAQSLRDQGIEACGRAVDIRKEHSVDSLFAGLLADGWFPDSLINNAGGQFAAPALDITPNGFRAVVDLNLTGSWLMSVAFARHFRALGRSSGSIVSIVLAQASGMPGMVHAAAARAGVVNMMKTLAYEWGPSGLTANAIAPGTVDTPALKGYDPARIALGVARLPIKRMARADEIAQAIGFLISKAGRFITGTVLEIDGGEHLTGAFCQHSAES